MSPAYTRILFFEFEFSLYKQKRQSSSMSLRILHIPIRIPGHVDNRYVTYRASAPPQLRTSRWGSMQPYPSADVAFDGTPNQGHVFLNDSGEAVIELLQPNSYFHKGRVIEPCVALTYSVNQVETTKVLFFKDLGLYTSPVALDTRVQMSQEQQIIQKGQTQTTKILSH